MSILPQRDRDWLDAKGIAFREVVDGGQTGIVFPGRSLRVGRFDNGSTDVLLILPPGYSNVAPDMFYTFPWVKLVPENRFPRAADQPVQFGGRSWQRWSRHNEEWRPEVDGIWTMLKRIEHALAVAA